MSDRPLILVTNDDGVDAVGLRRLAEAFELLGEVVVAAPAEQQSAISHGITLGQPLRVVPMGERRYAVTGKPADAVFLGISELSPRQPDLVVAGINHGPNLGVDVLYSGTVAAASEAAMRGIPALAVSQLLPRAAGERAGEAISPWHPPHRVNGEMDRALRTTAAFAVRVGAQMLDNPMPRVVINLNAPAEPQGGWRWTRLGKQSYVPRPLRRVDPRGMEYFWITGERLEGGDGPGTDVDALRHGDYSLTALGLDRSIDPPAATREWKLGGGQGA